MTPLWTFEELLAATGGTAAGHFDVHGVAFDSREIGAGDLFFALKGAETDGHLFIEKAFANGAAGAIVSQPVPFPHILVSDTMQALEALGHASRARTKAKIIGVTGSAGKTGTKEALFAALDRYSRGRAHRSVKSYNNHVGVPLSLARMPRDAAYGVFEMGMNHAGEIAALTAQVRPHVAVITTIAPAHIEMLGSMEAIADAKAETARADLEHQIRDHQVELTQRHEAAVQAYATYLLPCWGGSDAAIDALVETLIAAPDRESLINVTRALDRVLLWSHFVVPNWHSNTAFVAYWNRFGRPAKSARYAPVAFDTWWIDEAKDRALQRERK